jgi:hypothetical protein
MELFFAGDADAARDVEFVARVRAALHLPADVQLECAGWVRDARGEITLTYDLALPVQIEGTEFGAASGTYVDEAAIARLRFGARGELASSEVVLKDERHLRLVKDQIRKLADADQIYVPDSGERIDPKALAQAHQPWFVGEDARGRKRLKRAYIA